MLESNATPITEHIGDRPLLTAQPENPSQTLRFLVNHVGDVDESTSARVESGDITIRDILAAGLEELSLQRPTASNPTNAQESAKTPPVLRTDKILIPKKSMQGQPHPLPNIYANHLRIKQFSIIAALRANAELLGLTFEEITNPATESPLFSGAIAAESRQARQFAQLQVLKLDLRPTDAQTQIAHHPYVDLIPCPIFRQRFIHLASMHPPMIDQREFCMDLGKDGLICWGSYRGSRNEVTGSGAPWDIRSWEAQPWFLKKWWLLLGGAEGGFFQQTRWWYEVRGERLPSFC